MRVGIPTEIKNNECRVAATPAGVAELHRHGHDVIVQAGAGDGSAIDDNDYKAACTPATAPHWRCPRPWSRPTW